MDILRTLRPYLLKCTTNEQINVMGVQFDSRKVGRGDLFVAVNGNDYDGHRYIMEAIRAGAVAVVGEQEAEQIPVPYYQVSNSRQALAVIANELHGNPSQKHTMIGITGTNGKTTTAHLLRHILETAGITCTLIGTVSHSINGIETPSSNTTPDALQLQKFLEISKDPVVIMEVSSHGIHQHRIDGILFDYAVFTNLSHDHLNYHASMEDYYSVKASLFNHLKKNGEAIVNSSGEWGERLVNQLMEQDRRVYTFGEASTDHMQIMLLDLGYPLRFELRESENQLKASIKLPGVYNAWNAASAWLIARRMGVEAEIIRNALTTFPGVPGRFEVFSHPNCAEFVVDYAHTPDGFYHFLECLNAMTDGRIIHIFGFRGNGDPSKRRSMLNTSMARSDLIILTLDDLKGTSVDEQVKELNDWADQIGRDHCMVIEDRTKAIAYAWRMATKGDTVAITGKGRELYDQAFALPTSSDIGTIQYLMDNVLCSNY